MTREKAGAVARFIEEQFIKPKEPLVFVEALEVNGYLHRVYINKKISKCVVAAHPDPKKYEEEIIECNLDNAAITYLLDNPEIHDTTGTLHFRIDNSHGQQIFRSFTLMRQYKNKEERLLWLRWKYNLI